MSYMHLTYLTSWHFSASLRHRYLPATVNRKGTPSPQAAGQNLYGLNAIYRHRHPFYECR